MNHIFSWYAWLTVVTGLVLLSFAFRVLAFWICMWACVWHLTHVPSVEKLLKRCKRCSIMVLIESATLSKTALRPDVDSKRLKVCNSPFHHLHLFCSLLQPWGLKSQENKYDVQHNIRRVLERIAVHYILSHVSFRREYDVCACVCSIGSFTCSTSNSVANWEGIKKQRRRKKKQKKKDTQNHRKQLRAVNRNRKENETKKKKKKKKKTKSDQQSSGKNHEIHERSRLETVVEGSVWRWQYGCLGPAAHQHQQKDR